MRGKPNFLGKKYRVLFIASMLGWIVSLVGELSDSIIAGIFINEDAVSAISLVQPVFSMLMFLCYLIAGGTGTLYSRAAGEFDTDKAYKTAGMGVLVAILAGAILGFAMIFGEDLYFQFYAATEAIEIIAREYYECFIIVAFIYPIYWTTYYLVSIDGDAAACLAVDVTSAIGNAAASLILVNKFGVKGLALGTVAALFFSAIFIVAHFFKKSNSVKIKLHFDKKTFGKMVAIGSSSSLSPLYIAIVDIVINKFIIDNFGDSYLAAYAVVNLVLNLACCFSCAIDSIAPFICVSYGEDNMLGIKKAMKYANKTTLGLGIFFSAVIIALAKLLPDLY